MPPPPPPPLQPSLPYPTVPLPYPTLPALLIPYPTLPSSPPLPPAEACPSKQGPRGHILETLRLRPCPTLPYRNYTLPYNPYPDPSRKGWVVNGQKPRQAIFEYAPPSLSYPIRPPPLPLLQHEHTPRDSVLMVEVPVSLTLPRLRPNPTVPYPIIAYPTLPLTFPSSSTSMPLETGSSWSMYQYPLSLVVWGPVASMSLAMLLA